jgi:hypothetical protein
VGIAVTRTERGCSEVEEEREGSRGTEDKRAEEGGMIPTMMVDSCCDEHETRIRSNLEQIDN